MRSAAIASAMRAICISREGGAGLARRFAGGARCRRPRRQLARSSGGRRTLHARIGWRRAHRPGGRVQRGGGPADHAFGHRGGFLSRRRCARIALLAGRAVEFVGELLDQALDVLEVHLRFGQTSRRSPEWRPNRRLGGLRIRCLVGAEMGRARGPEVERIEAFGLGLIGEPVSCFRHRQRFGPFALPQRLLELLGHAVRLFGFRQPLGEFGFEAARGGVRLPAGFRIAAGAGREKSAPHEQMQEQKRDVNPQRRKQSGGQFELQAGDEPGAQRERKHGDRQHHECVAVAGVEGLWMSKLTSHRRPFLTGGTESHLQAFAKGSGTGNRAAAAITSFRIRDGRPCAGCAPRTSIAAHGDGTGRAPFDRETRTAWRGGCTCPRPWRPCF